MFGQCSCSRVLGRVVGDEFRELVGGINYVGSCKPLCPPT